MLSSTVKAPFPQTFAFDLLFISPQWESDPWPLLYQRSALPLSYVGAFLIRKWKSVRPSIILWCSWCREKDSNLRSVPQLIYSQPPLATRESRRNAWIQSDTRWKFKTPPSINVNDSVLQAKLSRCGWFFYGKQYQSQKKRNIKVVKMPSPVSGFRNPHTVSTLRYQACYPIYANDTNKSIMFNGCYPGSFACIQWAHGYYTLSFGEMIR